MLGALVLRPFHLAAGYLPAEAIWFQVGSQLVRRNWQGKLAMQPVIGGVTLPSPTTSRTHGGRKSPTLLSITRVHEEVRDTATDSHMGRCGQCTLAPTGVELRKMRRFKNTQVLLLLHGPLANAGHPGGCPCIVTCECQCTYSCGRSLPFPSTAATRELPKSSLQAWCWKSMQQPTMGWSTRRW
jgi:hypothetical protein